MFRWKRKLKLSLAVKCQVLFGAAAVLIIAAALYVPWQRMQQLTEQLNQRAAMAVALNALSQHMDAELERDPAGPTTRESWDAPRRTVEPTPEKFPTPRLVPVQATRTPEKLTRFERSAFNRFIADPDKVLHSSDYKTADGSWGYRFAIPLYLRDSCVRCHSNPALAAAGSVPLVPPLLPTTRATSPGKNPQLLLGIASIDIPSQIESNQILLNHVFILTAGLVAGLLAIVAFYFIVTRLILRPVQVLQETAERVSEGDLNIRSDINTGDEFQQLSETFNTMLANLQQGSDQLRAVNKSLDQKLGQLAESNVALYESNRLKSEFLANVSHELRTPLNSILGFAQLLKDSAGEADPKNARYIGNILQSGGSLLELINDLLDLAKIEAGRMEVKSIPVSLIDMFEALGNVLKPLTESKKLTLVTTVTPDVPVLQTDNVKLQQVLYNFLSNAIKFSPAGQSIELTAERDGPDHVRITVSDHGPGIPLEKQAQIFEKFRQLDGSVTRHHGGTGLGLSISKELTTLLGGTIGVRSESGAGASFWVTLPLRIEAGSQDVRERMVAM